VIAIGQDIIVFHY